MKKRNNADVLPSLVELQGKKVADIGCGNGALVRLMTRHGAKVIGVECNPDQLEKARQAKPAGDEIYYEGVAEDLPFDDNKMDVIVFFNSLHHVDVANLEKALSEAARALKPEGVLYVSEPIAEGGHFELMKPVHDETVVRDAAYKAVQSADQFGLAEETETTYIHDSKYPDFAAFKERMLTMNPAIIDSFSTLEPSLQQAFDTLGEDTVEGRTFDQPMRVNLLRKLG